MITSYIPLTTNDILQIVNGKKVTINITPGSKVVVYTNDNSDDIKNSINPWIFCDDNLPDDGVPVLVWYEYFRYGTYNCMCPSYGIGYHYNGCWGGDVSGVKARCIAWQPLSVCCEKSGNNI